MHMFRYYIRPCIFLFSQSDRLFFHVLELFGSSVSEENLKGSPPLMKPFDTMRIICSILNFMYDDARLHRSLSTCKAVIQSIHQNVLSLLVSCNSRTSDLVGANTSVAWSFLCSVYNSFSTAYRIRKKESILRWQLSLITGRAQCSTH